MELCSYGCGQLGKFYLKNGKSCCGKFRTQCPEVIKEITLKNIGNKRTKKIKRENPGVCDHGCGREAKFYFKIVNKWCCESHFSRCPVERLKSKISHTGIPSKVKGKKYKIEIIKEKPELCDYGCGDEAKYPLKNGKWCCSISQNSCLKLREKNSNRFEKRIKPKRENPGLCEYGCGNPAIHQLKNKKWCCNVHYQSCPEFRKKIGESSKGRVAWNKKIKIIREKPKLCDYGCGGLASFYLSSVDKWCCHKKAQSCPVLISNSRRKRKPKLHREKPELCDYGCGNEAKYQTSYEKWCCEKIWNKCPKIRKENSERQLLQKKSSWNKGLTTDDPRVDKNVKNANETRNLLLKYGYINVWNKGLTIDDPRVANYSKKCSITTKGKPNLKLRKPISNLSGSFGFFIHNFKKRLYAEWVFPILKRDEFKCTICGSNIKLEVHHLKKYQIIYKEAIDELKLDISVWRKWSPEEIIKLEEKILEKHPHDIGKTVCELCHSIIDSQRKHLLKKEKKELLENHERKFFGCKQL